MVLVLLSLLLLAYAGTRPSFDAYGWLVWGHQTVAGALDTNAAPSWKPLPYVFTVPYALAGHYELWLWMLTCVAASLGGALAAGRIAYRLTVAQTGRGSSAQLTLRLGGVLAGLFAAVAVIDIQGWWHYVLSAQSDTMIVALCLGAIDCHLSGHPRWAFALGALAALGRPEVWPFLGLYSIWAWRAIPSMRWLICAGILAVILLWFGVPALTSRTAFVSASNAFGSGRRLRSDQVGGTIKRFLELQQLPVEIAALVSVCWAALRRERALLLLSGGVLTWVMIEVAFSLHGWPGLGRYMFGAAGVTAVIAGVLVGRLLGALPAVRWLGAALALVLVASLIPVSLSRAHAEQHDLRLQRLRTRQIGRLSATVSALGGAARLRRCGEPLTRLEYQTVLAWTLHVNVATVGFRYSKAIHRGIPVVLFTPVPSGGWHVHALHQRSPACRRLPR